MLDVFERIHRSRETIWAAMAGLWVRLILSVASNGKAGGRMISTSCLDPQILHSLLTKTEV